MLNKGITIQTILLLVVAMIVMVVIIFLVYRTTTESTLSSTTCMGRVIDWCTRCKLKGQAAFESGGGGCDDGDPTKCPCMTGGPWVEKCLVTVGAQKRWNFDQGAASYELYEKRPWEYCQRVGVS